MNRLRNWWRSLSDAMRLRVLIIPILLLGTLVPTVWGLAQNPDWPGLALNFGTGMGGSLVTFVLIDLLIGSREKREADERERARLIGRMHSRDNGLTLVAIEEMRAHAWLIDGTLRGANLVHANLQAGYLRYAVLPEVNLHRANLHKTRLGKADLSGANLTDANLEGADLDHSRLEGVRVSMAQLAQANRLRGASMPGGERYDGRLSLPGDLHDAEEAGIGLSDPAAMAEFYSVSTEDYLAGQQWAQEHLPALRDIESAATAGPGDGARKQSV
jgi:hypothetical protein